MNLQLMAQVADLVGAITIIVSLIYVGIQVRQNTRSLHAENYAHALNRVSEMQARLSSNPDLVRIFSIALLDPLALRRVERIQFNWMLYETFGSFEFMYLQFRENALSDEVWKRWADTTNWWLQWPGVVTWWRSQPAPFTASFSAFVESQIGAPVAHPERARLWTEFMNAPTRKTD